jgi:hypothetical protein
MKKQFNNALFYFILALFTINVNTLKAQTKLNPKDKNKTRCYFKTYLETSYDAKETIIKQGGRTFSNQSKYFKIYPSIAFTKINAKGRLFEMSFALQDLVHQDDLTENSIDSLNVRLPSRGAETFFLAIGSRFEWAWQVKNMGESQFYLGISTNPVFSYENVVPYTTASFPSYHYDLATGFSVVPRWCWQLTDKLLIDINLPLTFGEIDLNYSYTGDPTLPTFSREKTELKASFVLKPQLRIGFGLRF